LTPKKSASGQGSALCAEFVFTVPSNRLFLKAALTGKVTGDVMMAMMVMDSNGL
jgi:hypothetical protein